MVEKGALKHAYPNGKLFANGVDLIISVTYATESQTKAAFQQNDETVRDNVPFKINEVVWLGH
jgi:hypothetical protein